MKQVFFVFLIVFCFGLQARFLTYGSAPDETVRLKLVGVENETDSQEFQIFNNFDSSSAFVASRSKFDFDKDKALSISSVNPLIIKCCKGSFVPVFVQDGGSAASGQAPTGFQGPYFISLWLLMPNVAETNKLHVRYVVKKDSVGSIGIRIGSKGDYRLVAYDNVQFIE